MVGLLITGPNASGKTTAARQVAAPYAGDPRLVLIDFDQECNNLNPAGQQARLSEVLAGPAAIVIVVGTNRAAKAMGLAQAAAPARAYEALVTTVTAETMAAMLQARCAKRGKTYRADYWDAAKLGYEGTRRFPALARRHFANVTVFPIAADYGGQDVLITYLEAYVCELGDLPAAHHEIRNTLF